MSIRKSRPLLLRGKVVHTDGTARDRYIFIRDKRVVSIGRIRPPRSEDAIYVETGPDDWVYPGLLDLHTHSAYNLLPLWFSEYAPFDNRFEWRSDSGYKKDVRDTYKAINTGKNKKILAVFAELQAVAGGTVVLQEGKDLDRETGSGHHLILCRDTANAADLLADPGKTILSIVDFFRPGRERSKPEPVEWALNGYVKHRKKGTLLATLAHLAEGRSGFGSNQGVDTYSRTEFETFMAHPAFRNAGAVRESPLTLIHCSGIDVHNKEHIAFLRDRNISVIWSPVSNLLLYGDTLDVETLLAEGINVGLGSDWSPSGSKHVWDEAKFARFYFDAIGSCVSDEQIFRMVTVNAGKCLGIPHLGQIQPGALADLFILRSPLESDSPLEVFFSTTDEHVRATIIGGTPCYGARDFLRKFHVPLQSLPRAEGSSVVNKAVHLPSGLGISVDRDISRLEKAMKALDPPVKRSNILVNSDKIYRRRIQKLRADTETMGWGVQEWRKKGPSEHLGQVLVKPNSVRVWRGVRADGQSPERFRKNLAEIFIPMAVQSQSPLGMTAYLPTVMKDDAPEYVPDEIALVFYESQGVYHRTSNKPLGRAYSLLHRPVFGSSSRSGFPVLLKDELKENQPYYLFRQSADWYHGLTRVLVGTRKESQSARVFRQSIFTKLKAIQKKPPTGQDGTTAVATADYLLYWEHWTDTAAGKASKIAAIASLVTPVLLEDAVPQKVATGLFQDFPGITIKGGECLNLRFRRRKLVPW